MGYSDIGTITHFDLTALTERYGLCHFVETGTGQGESLACAATSAACFASLRSCEIEPALWHAAIARFKDSLSVQVFRQRSLPFLYDICRMLPFGEPILFWLDAHFPGADYGVHTYGDELDSAIRLPLFTELGVIAQNRPLGRDVILIDDLRIYVDGPFTSGNLPETVRPFCPRDRGIDFIHEMFDATHTIEQDFAHEGYLVLTPKGTP